MYSFTTSYHIAEHFPGRKRSHFGTKQEFHGLLQSGRLPIIMWAWPQTFAEKTFTDGSETAKNARVFRYTVGNRLSPSQPTNFEQLPLTNVRT